jgi:hypothetical protein
MRLAMTAAIAALVMAGAGAQTARADDGDYGERDEINKTVTLSPGASVTISDISGPVEIETSNGDTAEIHVVRSARSRADLEKKKIVVESTPTSLSIHTEQHAGMHWDRVEVRQRVTLTLPRRVALHVNDVAGSVRVGEIDGDLRISDVAGSLKIGRVDGSPHVNDIAGSVMIGVGEIGAEGVHISDIAGRLEVVVASDANADVDIGDISGSIDVRSANVTATGKIDPEHFRGKIGGGGPQIAISDIAGSVTLSNGDR